MITKELDKIIKDRKIDLTASAKQFAETCGTEINIAKDYEGREIFELLQNCEDASTDQNFFRDVSVKITLKDNELKIQNTGEPFSLDGITSLMYQTLSPKSKVKLKTIGYKGLGFRSVLNWSSDIKIFTKEYSVAFSKSITDEWYSTLSDEIKKEMEDRKISVPILKIGKNISAEKNELDENYDTCIRLLCNQDKIDKILTELKTFKFYELLFLQHINKIEIKIEDDYWREIECVLEEGNKSIISYRDSLGTDSLSEWQMYYPNEKIEVELEEKDKSGKVQKVIKNFDVAFAYPLDDTIQHELRKSGVLFSYFATSNEFRLPFICHATFELESNRKNINDNSNNKRLVPYLIDEICKFAELIAMQMKDFSALNMLITDQNFGRLDHKGFGFYLGIKDENAFQKLRNGLKDKILTLNIFPTVSSICKKASEVKYSRYKWADYINVNDFSDLMLQPPIDTNQSIINYLNQKLSFYTDDEMIKNLNKSLDLYDEKKLIELTYLFVMQFPFSKSAPRTIIDESGNRIKEENANIYLNKESDVSLSFPKWSKSYFIKQSFEDALKNKFEASTKRSLADKLTKFNVDEYSYLPVLRSLISQAGNDKEKAIDLIKVLYASWESRGKLDVDIWSLPSRPKIQVVNRNGQVIDASSCYLGNEYDNALGERLLKCINITDFIAEPKVFELDNKDLTALRKFFNEIFVASFPKIELIDLPYIQRKKYLEFNKTKYSLLKVDKTWEEPYDYEDLGINTVKVYTIANIEDILSESKSEDILLWTVKDRLLNDKLGKYNESEKSFIKGRPYKKVDDRFVSYNQMLSYLNFIFSTSKWIEAEDGIKKMPKELVIDSTLPKAFSQFIATPIFDENLLIQNGISKFSALDILLKLGAVDDIKKLDKELIYKILLELPEKDITNEFGGSIYDWLNKKFDTNDLDSLVANNTNYSKFLKEGKLLCYGNRGYVPVAEVSYIDKKVVCESILQKMNTMKLHRRAGGPKIEKMFGAKSFKGVEISNISVTKCDDKTQQEFNKAYEILKPYVYADRYYKDKSGVNLRALQNIDIILCSNIIIMYNNKLFEVGNYENIYSIGEKEEKSIAYIKIPDGKNYYKLSQETDFQMSFAEIISAILDINGKENYQILIGKTEADMRKIFLASNTEENLKLAKEKLCDKDYFKRKFWHSVGSTYGIKLTEDTELDSILNQLDINISEWSIDYLDVLSGPSLPSLIKLFKHLDIDIDDFNKYSAEQLNLTSHYKQQFKCLQDRFQQKYLSYKINNYCKYKEDFSDIKKHYLFELFDNFNPDNSVKVNVQDEFEKALDVKISHLEAVQKQDIEELYNILESKYQTDIEPSPIPVLRPSEDDIVKKRIENITVIDMLDIKITKTNLQSHNHSNSTKRHTTIADETEREKRISGRICEELVYKKLCEEFGKDNVLWVSGNAKLAGINSKGSDDYGYDISYNDGCNIRKVEVKKTSSNSISFFISESEIRFAQRPENKDSYEIRCVKLDDNNNAIIKRLGNIFDLPNGEDLYNNSLFSIRSKNDYEIIAKELADNEDVSRA